MTSVAGMKMRIGARALAAALLLGSAAASLWPEQTTYAIESDPDGGSGDVERPSSGAAPRRRGRPKDDGTRCTYTMPNGYIDFFMPGDIRTDAATGRKFRCSSYGGWELVPFSVPDDGPRGPRGTENQQIP